MRKKQKYILNGAVIGGGILVATDILLQWLESQNNGTKLTLQTFDFKRTFKIGALGSGIGGLVGYGLYLNDTAREKQIPFNSNRYLQKVLSSEYLRNDPIYFDSVLSKRELTRKWVMKQFENDLAGYPEYGGSLYKGTAITSEYDSDIIIPFRRNSYLSLKNMFEDVYEKVDEKFGSLAKVRMGSKAIELTFLNEEKDICIDLVPGREINNYRIDKELNLYIRPEWFWQDGSSFKANIRHQKSIVSNTPGAKRIIKLLKIYKRRNNLPLSKVLIEQAVVEAMSPKNYGYHSSEIENLLNSMSFISKKLKQKTLPDFSNSNNNLNGKYSEGERYSVATLLENDIARIENNPRYLKEIFEL
jgi:hypothetical protein